MSTFALMARDQVGIYYTAGYVLAEDREEAQRRAQSQFGLSATARPVDGVDEAISCVEDLIRAENDLTLFRLALRRAA